MSTSVYKLDNCCKMSYKSSRKVRNTPEKVKRSLFGPVDHESNRIFIENQLSLEYNRGCRKWNFNFREEVQLDDDGDYIWSSPSPVFLNKKRKPQEVPDNSSAYYFQPIEGGSASSAAEISEPIRPIARSPQTNHRMQRQSLITDYMLKSKRPMILLNKDATDERPKKLRKMGGFCSS